MFYKITKIGAKVWNYLPKIAYYVYTVYIMCYTLTGEINWRYCDTSSRILIVIGLVGGVKLIEETWRRIWKAIIMLRTSKWWNEQMKTT